jgi:hypothetical protein
MCGIISEANIPVLDKCYVSLEENNSACKTAVFEMAEMLGISEPEYVEIEHSVADPAVT